MKRALATFGLYLVVVAVVTPAAIAQQTTLGFNGQVHGQIITNQYQSSGVTISANNPNRPFDLAIIFDSLFPGSTSDPDLQGPPWSGGNLAPATILGPMLILAENNVDVLLPFGVIDTPDDEGSHPAGDLIFDFANPINTFGFDIVDVEGFAENGRVNFYSGSQLLTFVNFSQFVTPGAFFDPTVAFGDHTANRITPFTTSSLGIVPFNKVVVTLGGSGAVDNIVIPEPVCGGLLVIGGVVMFARRRMHGHR